MEKELTQTILAYDEFLGTAWMKRAAGGFSLGHWLVDKCGAEVKPHGHKSAHFVFVTGGHYITTATGNPPRGRSHLVYNPPGTFHNDRFESSPGSFFTISIAAELVGEAAEVGLPRAPTQVGCTIPYAIACKLMRQCVQWQSDSMLIVEALCLEMLGAIAAPSTQRRRPAWLTTARDVLQDRYAEEIAMKDLSRAVGVHPIHLTRSFRAFYHCTPGEFLRVRRLQQAAELLTSTRLPLVEVALKSGFADQSHFTKHFRRTYGVPPGEYRRLTTASAARG